MESNKILKILGIALIVLAIWGVIETIIVFPEQKDKINQIIEESKVVMSNNEEVITFEMVYTVSIIFSAIVAVIEIIIGWRTISQANGNVKAKGHITWALIFCIITVIGLIGSFKDLSNENWMSVVSSCVVALIYGMIYFFGRKLQEETED